MTKSAEHNNPYSCWNRAKLYERVFIVMERDAAAPAAIRAWAAERIALGLNRHTDVQIEDALHCATMMATCRDEVRGRINAEASMGQGDAPLAQDGIGQSRSR